MRIRNSLVVLTKLIDVFPTGRGTADVILNIVETLTNEDREDVKIMAKRYFALLTKRKTSLIDDKLLRTHGMVASSMHSIVSNNEPKDATSKLDQDKKIVDSDRNLDTKLNITSELTFSRHESQELESGEILSGKNFGNSSSSTISSTGTKQRETQNHKSNMNDRGGQGRSFDSAHDRRNRLEKEDTIDSRKNVAEEYHDSKEETERWSQRGTLPALSGQSGLINSRVNDIHDRGRSASRVTHEHSQTLYRSRSRDRLNDRDSANSNRRASFEGGSDREQVNRAERSDGDRRGRGESLQRSSLSRSPDHRTRDIRDRDETGALMSSRRPELSSRPLRCGGR